jgi:hypothetical protein
LQRLLLIVGLLLVVLGLLWPWLGRLPLGRLPGDITLEGENWRVYFPFTSAVLVSLLITLLLWLFKR